VGSIYAVPPFIILFLEENGRTISRQIRLHGHHEPFFARIRFVGPVQSHSTTNSVKSEIFIKLKKSC
jgi:hypothetical protein